MMKFIFALIAFFLPLCNFVAVGECRAVVFVLNAGQSMNTSDPFHAAPESIVWATKNLSEEDEVGIVTFKDSVNIVRPLSKIKDNPAENFSVIYSEQNNAGAGLLSALDMLSPKFNTRRDIVFITNGEINNSQSSINFNAGLKQAQWLGISVYLVDLRHNVDPKYYREYGNVKFLPINYRELMTTIRTILQGDWQTPHIEFPTNNLTKGELNFEVPVTSADSFKISLLSSNVGKATLKNVHIDSAIQDKFINVFDIKAPSTNKFEIAVDYPQGTGLTLDVTPTVAGNLQIDYTRLPFNNILEITPVYAKDSTAKIFADKFFDDKNISVLINDKNVVGKIDSGIIEVPIDDFDENISLQKIYFENVGITFNGDDTAQLLIPKIPYAALMTALFGILMIAGLSYLIYRKYRIPANIEKNRQLYEVREKNFADSVEKILPKANAGNEFSYGGKLMIYVIKTPDSEDVAPREFNLFRMNSAQIPLAYILEQCAIDKFFETVQNIFINPAKNCITVENKSDCTITKRNILVEKGGQVDLYYNDSVNILSGDATAELIMLYKSLKPN